MKVITGILVIVILAVTAVLWIQPFEAAPEDAVFVYYPKSNIYLNADKKSYLVFDSTEKVWKKSKSLTSSGQAALGKAVTLGKSNETTVWRNNDQHRLIYGTSLYTNSDDVKKKYYEDSIRSLPPKPPAVVKKDEQEAEAEKKRSGFRRFMDKIFKKKEKKN